MKTKLLIALFAFFIFNLSAQTTHNLDWFIGIGSNVDLTIQSGDTVIWTWTSPNHTVENDPAGTSVEVLNSGFLGPNGSTFSHTFTAIGSNDYYCSVHGAGSMSGTITVGTLDVDEFSLNQFKISPNPVFTEFNIELPSAVNNANVEVFDVLGKKIHSSKISNFNSNIDVSNWYNGVYLVRVSSGNVLQTKRIIKQ